MEGTFTNIQGSFTKDRNFAGTQNNDMTLISGVFIASDGSILLGDFVRTNFSGYSIKKWPNGTIYTGEFVKREPSGRGVMATMNSRIFIRGSLGTAISA